MTPPNTQCLFDSGTSIMGRNHLPIVDWHGGFSHDIRVTMFP